MNKSLRSINPTGYILSPLLAHCTGSSRGSSDCQVSRLEGGVATWTHLRSLTGRTHWNYLTHTWDWQVTFRCRLITEPAGEVGFSKELTSFRWPHLPRQRWKSANRFSYLWLCVCWDTGTMAAAAGRGGKPATGRCSGTGRLQTHRGVERERGVVGGHCFIFVFDSTALLHSVC